jgi:hypothetical protein
MATEPREWDELLEVQRELHERQRARGECGAGGEGTWWIFDRGYAVQVDEPATGGRHLAAKLSGVSDDTTPQRYIP